MGYKAHGAVDLSEAAAKAVVGAVEGDQSIRLPRSESSLIEDEAESRDSMIDLWSSIFGLQISAY
jgi:hypothetical protein